MNAWIVRQGALELADLPLLPPAPHRVRVRVRYAGVGFADVMAAAGGYPLAPREPFSPGYEFVGTIEATGQRVGGLLPSMGAYRQWIDVDPETLVPVPDTLGDDTAALLPLNYLTAEALLSLRSGVKRGDSVLIHGAAGGVGSALLELAVPRGITVYGSADPTKHADIAALGGRPLGRDWERELAELEPAGVTAGFDSFGGASLERTWHAVRRGGTFVSFGFSPTAGGGWTPFLAGLASLAWKNLVPRGRRALVCGTPGLTRSRPEWYRATLARLYENASRGELKPRLHDVLPWTDAPRGHQLLASRQVRGKVLLQF
jgi:NADPH:quinone reductase-like Zn-dependent oxidoreductase